MDLKRDLVLLNEDIFLPPEMYIQRKLEPRGKVFEFITC